MLKWIVINIAIPIQTLRIARIRYNGVGTEETVKIRVIISGVIKVQSRRVFALTGVLVAGGRGAGGVARLAPGLVAQFGHFAAVAVRRDGR